MAKEYRIYFEKKFYKQKDGYWVAYGGKLPWAHRWVWINHHGAIPKGMDIHHIDGDKDNNEIDNLEMLSRSDHLKRHWENPVLRQERRKFLNEIRPKVHEWLRSEKGRNKQREISKKAWGKRKKTLVNCKECGKQIMTTQPWTKFCSSACTMRCRRREKPNNVEIICLTCNKLFYKDKYSPQRFCSISCGVINSRKNRK